MMIMRETKFESGDLVAMINDKEENVGIVSGYKIMPDSPVEYLIVWGPTMSSWAYDFELKEMLPPSKLPFEV
jgi:hypothetical protein